MKIGKLQDRCGICKLIDYCTEPYTTPHLCASKELKDIEEGTYKQTADGITEEEIQEKLRQYEENNISPWTDGRNGAICDIFLEKLYRNEVQQNDRE